eukprot:CAMPEP_0114250178 /NCGR_PEP_ID=MMETSP0058-20121206/14557_1 /TAXON_ID=36894 /ORGANISM="Pyramimonas parkeae, CCMP726" /LENGTH=230 /DNA_ID=CAMNT_0001363813 /DNA_START=115 /DNA_END=807 /DNA_ORIENTATION=+
MSVRDATTFSIWLAMLGMLLLAGTAAGCDGAYCHRLDLGSCGNACCKLEWVFHADAAEVARALNSSLHSGGPDGLYQANPLHEGVTGFASLEAFPVPAAFIGQGTHTTRVERYNDTLNFAVYKTSATESKVTAFSISNVGGALGDEGQNYSNLEELVQSLGMVFSEEPVMGCSSTGGSESVGAGDHKNLKADKHRGASLKDFGGVAGALPLRLPRSVTKLRFTRVNIMNQ